MGEFELWVGTHKQTSRKTHRHRHINTMTQPGLGAGPSEEECFFICRKGQLAVVLNLVSLKGLSMIYSYWAFKYFWILVNTFHYDT